MLCREWYLYNELQIELIEWLIKDIVECYNIELVNVVVYSDIVLLRKFDSGLLFFWKCLVIQGIGVWLDDVMVIKYIVECNKYDMVFVSIIQ